MNKPTAIKRFIFLFVFMLLGFVLTFCQFNIPFTTQIYKGFANSIKLGLDLKGGVLAVYEATPSSQSGGNFDSNLNATVARLQNVLTKEGYPESVVSVQDGNKIRVEVPDVEDPQTVFDMIGNPAELEFRASETGEAELTGKNISDVYASYQQSSSGSPEYGVVIKFDAEGSTKFFNLTKQQAEASDNYIYIYAVYGDGTEELVSKASVSEGIAGGSTFISGSMNSQEEAESFALQIMSGTFSVNLTLAESSVISATLGVDAIKYGLIAAVIGIFLMIVYMIWRYKIMGLLASFALMFYIILYLFFLQAIPLVQLTLEGIAGIILSIGMAIDANIIIFERIKEEYAYGKRLQPSIEAGFKRARPAILDSNITTLISALILYFFGTGSIQGFAITLFIGIVLSMFSALVISKTFLNWYYYINSNKANKYSLKREVQVNAK